MNLSCDFMASVALQMSTALCNAIQCLLPLVACLVFCHILCLIYSCLDKDCHIVCQIHMNLLLF